VKAWFEIHEGLVGMILVGIATVGSALSGILKSKGDAYAKSAAPSEKFWPYFWWITCIVTGVFLSGFGTWLTKRSGDAAAKEAHKIDLKFAEQLHDMAARLDAAKRSDSQELTDAKMQVLKTEFRDWAQDLSANLPAERQQFLQLKKQLEIKNKEEADSAVRDQIERSERFFPVFSFAIQFMEGSVSNFAKVNGYTNVVIDKFALPKNFYSNNITGRIRIGENARWEASISRGWSKRTQYEDGPHYIDPNEPYLVFIFHGKHDTETGHLVVQVSHDYSKIRINYETTLPVPDTNIINGDFEKSDYEDALKRALREIIKAQLLDSDNAAI
jgi:hypothetical protein